MHRSKYSCNFPQVESHIIVFHFSADRTSAVCNTITMFPADNFERQEVGDDEDEDDDDGDGTPAWSNLHLSDLDNITMESSFNHANGRYNDFMLLKMLSQV